MRLVSNATYILPDSPVGGNACKLAYSTTSSTYEGKLAVGIVPDNFVASSEVIFNVTSCVPLNATADAVAPPVILKLCEVAN